MMRRIVIALMPLVLCACMGELQLIQAAARADRDEPRTGDRVIVTLTDGEQRRVVFESIDSRTLETADGPIPLSEVESIEIDQSSARVKIERAGRVTVAIVIVLLFWALLAAPGG